MEHPILRKRWWGWEPGPDTALAALMTILFIGSYYATTHLPSGSPEGSAYYVLLFSAIVIFPVWWIVGKEGLPFSEIGITTRYWKESLLIGLAVAVFFGWQVFTLYAPVYGADLLPHLVVNGLMVWEPFFVYCWLQLRYERAFGIAPAIILAGLSFAAYHIGTYPSVMVLLLAFYGIAFAVLFRLTKNILILWPLSWSVSAAKGTLAGGMLFIWHDAGICLVVLLLQAGFMLMMHRRSCTGR